MPELIPVVEMLLPISGHETSLFTLVLAMSHEIPETEGDPLTEGPDWILLIPDTGPTASFSTDERVPGIDRTAGERFPYRDKLGVERTGAGVR
jgi:hypothetical protein